MSGVRSAVLEGGPAAAEQAVVFVHGSPGSSRDWEELVGAVGAFGRAVALDMPGFGRADRPDGFDYTVAGYARHLAGCLAALGVVRAHLVLHDLGGPWGLAWAVAHPDAFASASLVNTGVWPDYRWHAFARIWRTPVLGEILMAAVTRPGFHLAARYRSPRGLPWRFVDRMYDDYDRGTRRAILKLYRATGDPSGLGYALAAALRPLDRPALVVWGRHDPYLPLRLAERQREAFPSARVVVLEHSGHFPFADDPSGLRDALLPFLRQHLAG